MTTLKFSSRIGPLLKTEREKAKLTQQQLADRANVGVATLQNIELGKGNPSLNTIEALLEELGLCLALEDSEADFSTLAALGVPLFSLAEVQESFKPDQATLIAALQKLAPAIRRLSLASREVMALSSFLCALRDHFPETWSRIKPDLEDWLKRVEGTAMRIKLRRISIQYLAEYL